MLLSNVMVRLTTMCIGATCLKCWRRLQAHPNIDVQLGKRISAFTEDSTGVELEVNGLKHRCDLLVGADGIHSAVREHSVGQAGCRFTGNMAWRMLVPANQLPEGLIADNATVWWGPGKHFVHYLVSGGRFVNCVCVVETDMARRVVDRTRILAELKADFTGWHQSIQALLARADESTLFKWGSV